ncbi:ATP-dependent RNA helicase mtr4 [Entomophthora muscae]|uniref:ATP-dependent RNA helicase mtr4 n=1 Tax=Entomophthora muscae TaxID=34485 RepID=A0ACC2TCK5_9FUNG|nr:ATP-dependent RNA helicase mtr4 [Entomophthora muscae]
MLSDSDDDVYAHIISKKGVVNPASSSTVSKHSYNQKATLARPDVEQQEPKRSKPSLADDPEAIKALDVFEQEHARQVDEVDGKAGKVELRHQIRHEVAIPPGYPYIPISQHVPSKTPAREYPFPLDPFQRVAINSIERNESVLVAAHTSAGKTVVAEYAIAQAMRNHQRVIYTSPIKALSNQKFREFTEEFGDVGLMTGDVTIAPTATCLVMTTEILRSMLYRGSEVMREVAWVIFDEVHYMRDKERGVVWEETLILLPDKVRHVFLSATIPNAHQFASWICNLHQQPCHVVYTDFRPTPLQHYLFPKGADGIHLVVDEKGNFRDDNFENAVATLQAAEHMQEEKGGSGFGLKKRKPTARGDDSDISKVIKMILMRNYHPVIVFSFGKRECENYANEMSKIDFNTAQEQQLVAEVFSNAIAPLDNEDRSLPQITNILPLLKRGIGIHHSGLLPVLKEVIEILFQEGLIKVLFATETFSIGLNMPAKTVVFTSVRKFDGTALRWVSSGEYIQMSGRAGRRGLDARGIVIMMMDEKIEPAIAKAMIRGESDPLDSAFHLSYNMLLNQLRVEGISPEYILERCFLHFQSKDHLPVLEKDLKRLDFKLSQFTPNLSAAAYLTLHDHLQQYTRQLRDECNRPEFAIPFLNPGRLCRVEHNGVDFGVGVIVKYSKCLAPSVRTKELDPHVKRDSIHMIDMLLYVDPAGRFFNDGSVALRPGEPVPSALRPATAENGKLVVVPVVLEAVNGLSAVVVNLPSSLDGPEPIRKVHNMLNEVKKRFGNDIILLDPVSHLKVDSKLVSKLTVRIKKLKDKMAELLVEMGGEHLVQEKLASHKLYLADQKEQKALTRRIKSIQTVHKMDELKCMKRVLRRLGYISEADVVEVKGRVACEIMSEHGLLLAELMFQGFFSNLTVEQTAALLSVFVFDDKVDVNSELQINKKLEEPFKIVKDHARNFAKVSTECKLDLDPEDYASQLSPHLINAVYAWSRGASFAEVCEMTPAFEGSIIRVFRRLEELIRQMAQAAKAIGNTELEAKFAHAILLIKRGIIFSASLYL